MDIKKIFRNKKLDMVTEQMNRYRENCKSLQNHIEWLKDTLEDKEKELNGEKSRVKRALDENEKLENEKDNLEIEIDELQKLLVAEKTSNEALKEHYRKALEENDRLNRELNIDLMRYSNIAARTKSSRIRNKNIKNVRTIKDAREVLKCIKANTIQTKL